MITVGHLKRSLAKVPDNAVAYAYEGEVSGIVVCTSGEKREVAMIIHADERKELQDGQVDTYMEF